MASEEKQRIPEATVARLPLYYRSLLDVAENGVKTVSSERLAELAGVNAANVRKDLSHLGSYGTRGVGYDVTYLMHQISRELGLTKDWPAAIVGVGSLGTALANYRGFASRGFRIAGLFDSDPAKIGQKTAGLVIRSIAELEAVADAEGIAIGIIAVPASEAQRVADMLVTAGASSILNFAPVVISVPEDVAVRKVDLAIELQILSFYQNQRAGRDVAVEAKSRRTTERAGAPSRARIRG